MISASDIADYFLSKTVDEDSKITNLKLQKLLYYAQGFHLALFDKELFSEDIKAWQHGPVCESIYHKYKCYGSNVISNEHSKKDFGSILSKEQVDFLDEIYDIFGQYSAWKLRDMTHEEPTWINNKDSASVIPKEELKDYFDTRVA